MRTEDQLLEFAVRRLDRDPRDLPFTLTYLFDDGGGARLAEASGIAADHPLAPTTLGTDAMVWPVARLARAESVLIDLHGPTAIGLPTRPWPEPPVQALMVPLLQQGSAPVGFLVAGLNRYRALDEGYRGFVESSPHASPPRSSAPGATDLTNVGQRN